LTLTEHRFCSEHGGRKIATGKHKMLKTVYGNEDLSIYMSLNGLNI
jgi:hypothetical protein